MAPRMLTLSGLRRIDPGVSLPRETTAAAKLADGLLQQKQALVQASTPDQVEQVIAQAWGRTMADLAIPRDPHVTMASSATLISTAATAQSILEADLFKAAPGATATQWKVTTNLMRDDEALRPVLIKNIGAVVGLKSGDLSADLAALAGIWLELRRAKTIIAEIPLLVACVGLVAGDKASTPMSPVAALGSGAGGGYELEGHGSVYLPRSDSALQLWLRNPGGASLAAGPSGVSSVLSVCAFIDGEALE